MLDLIEYVRNYILRFFWKRNLYFQTRQIIDVYILIGCIDRREWLPRSPDLIVWRQIN